MKQRYRLFLRSNEGNFYLQDNLTGKQESLRTKDRATAESLLHARNEAVRQPELNIQLDNEEAESGLKLLTAPHAPKELPVTALLRNAHGVAEWKLFLKE